jgi:cysteine desulfurase
MNPKIHLDNNAGTLVDPRLIPTLIHHFQKVPGNPSSVHTFGQEARGILSRSRYTVANFLKVKTSEIIFTSSGTEALNMVLRGICIGNPNCHIITSTIEHSAVYMTIKYLEATGCKVTYLEPGLWGAVKPEILAAALKPETRVIALMAVNNETGVKTDIEGIAKIAKENGTAFIVDGVAWLGKEQISIPDGVSAMCFSGYKFHAPKGIGFAYIRSSLKLTPLMTGGNQEFGRRGGTENLPGIVALSEAVNILADELPEASQRMAKYRDKLERSLIENLSGVSVNGLGPRICNTTNLSFEGVEGETLLTKLDMEGVLASHGSACSSGALKPSRVLLNMGIKREVANSSIRFSLSRLTTENEIDRAIAIVMHLVSTLRRFS